METSKVKSITSWVLVALLAMGYLAAAIGKLTGGATAMFVGWGYAPWFAMLIGGLEVIGAIGLLVPKTTRYAVLGLTVIMVGAAYTHITNGEAPQIIRPGIFLALLWTVWWLRDPNPSKGPPVTEQQNRQTAWQINITLWLTHRYLGL